MPNLKSEIKKHIPDSIILKYDFKKILGRKLDLKCPKTLNEKLQWLKIYDRKPIYTTMVDKYAVKDYVASIIGEEYIIPTIGIWESFDDINFNLLPNQFVMKCTHDSGSTIVCKNKKEFDIEFAKSKINKCLAQNFYYRVGREWPYKDVKPRILIEEFIADTPYDYKFYMFNGKMDSVMVCTDRENGHAKFRFYDKDWKRLIYMHPELEPDGDVFCPDNFGKMIDIAEKLSSGFPHIRVDLYNIEGQVYFGELTFYNQS